MEEITNLRFRWQGPLGEIIFVLLCIDTRRDEEKETQHINVVGKTKSMKKMFQCDFIFKATCFMIFG